MSFICHSHVICMSFVCHSYAICMSFVCHSYAICMSFVCQTYVLVCYSYVICMLLVCARILSVCTRMSSVSHSYLFIYHPCATRIYSYVIHMSLVCGLTVNFYYMQMLPVNRHNTVLVRMELSNDFQFIIYFSCLKNVQKSSVLTH